MGIPATSVFLRASLSAAATVALTWCAVGLRVNLPSASFLYLPLIVISALHLGFGVATVGSVIAVLGLDYFFIPPVHSLNVSQPDNWVALITFECTALIVSRLSTEARQQARIARDQNAGDLVWELKSRLADEQEQVPLIRVSDGPRSIAAGNAR